MLNARFRPIYDSEMSHILLKRALSKILIGEVKNNFTGFSYGLEMGFTVETESSFCFVYHLDIRRVVWKIA